jgi:SsrA-binding protein
MPVLVKNKKATFDYHILEKMEAGIVLLGKEVKAVREGKASLVGAFVSVDDNECFLVNCHISPYQPKNTSENYDPRRKRKLLLSRKQIDYLSGKKKERGISIIPLSIYTKKRLIKLEVGIGRGKKKYDKREALKRKTIERDLKRIR